MTRFGQDKGGGICDGFFVRVVRSSGPLGLGSGFGSGTFGWGDRLLSGAFSLGATAGLTNSTFNGGDLVCRGWGVPGGIEHGSASLVQRLVRFGG